MTSDTHPADTHHGDGAASLPLGTRRRGSPDSTWAPDGGVPSRAPIEQDADSVRPSWLQRGGSDDCVDAVRPKRLLQTEGTYRYYDLHVLKFVL